MSFLKCIENAAKEGKITPEQADQLRRDYQVTEASLALEFGPHAGDEAARRVYDALEFETLEARRRKLLQAKAAGPLVKAQSGFRNYRGNIDPSEFMINLIDDPQGKLGGVSSVQARYKAIKGQAHALVTDVIAKFERDVLTRTRNKAVLRDVVRAAFGDNVSPEAGNLAKAWGEAAEYLRARFNAAGGDIAKLENWGLPQSHDAVAVARAGFDRWADGILPRLDRSKMIDGATGHAFTEGQLRIVLRDVFDTITTEGAAKIEPTGYRSGASLAKRRSAQRFLVFRNADDWLSYQDQFGKTDPFASMMAHLDDMARDIGAMEILGPNPNATLELLAQTGRKEAGFRDQKTPDRAIPLADRQQGKAKQAMAMYDLYTGISNIADNKFIARALRPVRDLLTSMQLGSAALSAVTDNWTQRQARVFNGVPAAGQTRQLINLMLPTSKSETHDAVRLGLIADGATQIASSQARYTGEVHATGIAARLVDGVMRTSLLAPMTQAGRWSFGMEFFGMMARRKDQTLAQLQAGGAEEIAFSKTLQRYGLAGSWDDIRRTPNLYEPQSKATFLRPQDIAARTDIAPSRAQYLADRVLEMVQSETDQAIPTASLRARSALQGGTRPGSISGELLKSVAMYKSFPTTIAYYIASRAMAVGSEEGAFNGIKYAAQMTVGMTVYGALAIQLKQLKAGRDPRDMTGADFWQAAALQGGGLGIFGDFLFADTNRFGGSLGETLAGPVISALDDARKFTVGSTAKAISGDDPRLGRQFFDGLRRYTPGGNLWYAELAYHRLVIDQLQASVDPDHAAARARRREQSARRDYGQAYFWAPGSALPARAPDIAAVAGQ